MKTTSQRDAIAECSVRIVHATDDIKVRNRMKIDLFHAEYTSSGAYLSFTLQRHEQLAKHVCEVGAVHFVNREDVVASTIFWSFGPPCTTPKTGRLSTRTLLDSFHC